MVRAIRTFSAATLAALFTLLAVPEKAFTNQESVAVESKDGAGVPEGRGVIAAASAQGGTVVPTGAGDVGDVPPDLQDVDRAPSTCDEPEESDGLGEVWCEPQSRHDASCVTETESIGDASPELQGSPVSSSERTAKCTVTWRAGSSICKDAGKTGSCTARWEGKHATLEEAKKECERQNRLANDPGAVTCECQWEASVNNDCYDKCDAIAEKEREKCNKMDPGPGRAKCNQAVQEQWAACYEECRKKK
jgi:hypothetical protein